MRWHTGSASSLSADIVADLFRLIPPNERQHSAKCWKSSFMVANCPITRSAVPPSAYGTDSCATAGQCSQIKEQSTPT